MRARVTFHIIKEQVLGEEGARKVDNIFHAIELVVIIFLVEELVMGIEFGEGR